MQKLPTALALPRLARVQLGALEDGTVQCTCNVLSSCHLLFVAPHSHAQHEDRAGQSVQLESRVTASVHCTVGYRLYVTLTATTPTSLVSE